MFNQIFTAHLKEKNILSAEQADDALETVRNTRSRIGALAVETGLMTYDEAKHVNQLQASQNARFGDIAIEKGYISKEDFQKLLNNQPKPHIILKQIVTDKKYISPEKFEEEMEVFQKSLRVSDDVFAKLQDNDEKAYVTYIAGVGKENIFLHNYAELFIKLVIRLIDPDIRLEKAEQAGTIVFKHTVLQKVFDIDVFKIALGTTDTNSAVNYAEAFCKYPINGMDEDGQDSLKEFLNCVAGMFITELSNNKIMEMNIDVPEYHEDIFLGKYTVVIPFSLPQGDFVISVLQEDL